MQIKRPLTVVDKEKRRILERYPKIFAQKDLPITHTCMCWGLEVGGGWLWLIDELCRNIQEHIDMKHCPQLEATQVKEKYGGLRFYYSGGDNVTSALVGFAEHLSYKICEDCGATEGVTQTKGWIVTLCPACMEQYKKDRG